MPFKYSVILDVLAMIGFDVNEKPHEVLDVVKESGIDGVDVGTPRISAEDKKKVADIVSIARSKGLDVPAFLGAWAVWHGGEERDLASSDNNVRAHAVDYAKGCVAIASELDVRVFEICAAPGVNTYPASKVPVKTLRENFVKSIKELCEFAQDRNVEVIVEPINRFEGHPGFMNSLVEAAELVASLDIPNLGVLGDLFHMNIEDIDNSEAYRAAGKYLKHIHLADHNRQLPGTGRNDFKSILRALEEIGFDGYLSLDCVPPRPSDVKVFLNAAMDYMKAVERANEMHRQIAASDLC